MRGKIQLIITVVLISGFFISMAATTMANEEAPCPKSSAVVETGQGTASGDAAKVPMDPGALAVFPADSFDFGWVYEDADVFHDFIVKNGGTADLKIINVKDM